MNAPPNREVALFSAALGLPAGQRAAYLDQACADDPALRQRVDTLLRVHNEALRFLENPAPGAQSSSAGAEAVDANARLASSPAETAGDGIGRYKLLQQIGEGGCGVVYMAEQEEPVRRRVALKVIKLGMDTKQVIARFEAERQALALMDHPNIAKVLDAGATDTGRPFFVMELVRGIKITDYCDENNLSTEERLKLFTQVCQAVQHAHQKGIIHRDIKPSNILVTIPEPGAPGCPKVIDFGIAKATTGQQLTDKTLFTAFEQFIGTPAYMSPEQAMMTALDIDTRTDIYSLGVLLYELLTGKTPLDQQELLAAGLEEMRRTIREKEPVRPSTRLSTMLEGELTTTAKHRHTDAPKLIHAVRGDLDWIVMKCLEKDRARRYETANGLANDIQRHLNCEPVVARPPSRLYEFQKTVRRHKFGFAATAAIGVSLVVGFAISTWQFALKSRAVREQIRLREQAQKESARSRQIATFLTEMLQGVGPSAARGRDTTMLREVLDKTAERVGRELKGQPEVEAELRSTLGTTYFELGEWPRAEAAHREALRLRKAALGETNELVANSLYSLGNVLWRQSSFDEAESVQRAGLAIRRRLLGNQHPDVADSLAGLAGVLRDRGNPEAEAAYREALAIRRALPGVNYEGLADVLNELVPVLNAEGKLAEAESKAREAVELGRNLGGNGHPSLATALLRLGNSFQWQSRLAEAEAMYREGLAMRRQVLGNVHPYIASALEMLAKVLEDEDRGAEAVALRRECVAIREKSMAGDWQLFIARYRLAKALLAQGQRDEAEPLLLTAYRGMKERENQMAAIAKNVPAEALEALVRLLRTEGKIAEAQQLEQEAAEHGGVATQNEIAWRLANDPDPKLRDASNAVVYAEKAVQATGRTNRGYLATLAAAYATAGQVTNALGVRQEAKALLARSIPARGPTASTNLIDLSSFYNALLTERWHEFGAGDLSELPQGIQTFAGVQFEVRGLIQVAAALSRAERYPDTVRAIPIHRTCRRIHFLHAAIYGADAPGGAKIGRYIAHFDSGTEAELPIIMGQSLADWWNQPDEQGKTFTIAWVGQNAESRRQGRNIRLFKSTWENPTPSDTVSTIDFIGYEKGPAPFLVAITVE
jgi:serine/threonine protein kinase